MNYRPQRIDVHHHFLPPQYLAWLKAQGIHWTGGPLIPEWNLDIAQEVMERNGIAQAIASPVPQVYWGDTDDAARWARHCNEFSASMVQQAPDRFGAFATLPLPDTKAALKELEYALDALKLDGVIMFSSFGDQYPGDPMFEELFQELDKRKAVVLIHPCTAPPGAIVPKLTIPWGMVEFIADTSRAVTNLLLSGTLHRYPSIRYIVSHAGGAIPYISLRLKFSEEIPGIVDNIPLGTMHYLRKLYYDTTLSTSETVLAGLRQFVPTSQMLFGSDYPMVPEKVVSVETSMLEASRVLDDATRQAIDRDNALALFPRLANLRRGAKDALQTG
ncbi:putative TIM-barrel fold metal-dependent hydrolase [Lysobacter niastensis]|uniref:TIM-barrel fold metal-dependent hydrolase n=1 Tax=Lysobacter niastensis TaxID=380629 RepID=A0ABU1WD94_9GAMM|nr:amidohydrolase family protein [Lysobacter niastensis]MDR7135517.1 putative TIM-barrel fold metal-dependent hydrolase [Lysobacter niastensis]